MTPDPAPIPVDRGPELHPPALRMWIVAALLIGLAVLGTVGIAVDRAYTRRTRESTNSLLTSIARGHSLNISAFIAERIDDATLLAADERARQLLAATTVTAQVAEEREAFGRALRSSERIYGYHDFQLFDRAGRSVLFTREDESDVPDLRSLIDSVLAARAPRVVPLLLDAEGELTFGVLVPVPNDGDPAAPPVGVLYASLRAEDRLLAFIRASFSEGGSSDVVLLQQEHDSIHVFGARHTSAAMPAHGAALPLHDTAYVAARAFRDRRSAHYVGLDFRGIPVRAAAEPVVGTPWLVIAKLDLAEAESRIRATRIFGTITFLLLLLAVALLARSLARRREREYHAIHARLGERALRVVQTSLDGYIAIDPAGRIVELNAALARMTGYEESELLRMSLGDLKVLGTEETVAAVLDRIRQHDGIEYVSRWRRKDGTPLTLAVSARFLPDASGGRIFAFVRDITEAQRTQARLERANRLYLFLNRVSEGLLAAGTRQEAFSTLCRITAGEEVFALATVALVDDARREARIVEAAGAASEQAIGLTVPLAPDAPLPLSPVARCVHERRPVVVVDYQGDPATTQFHALAREHGVQSSVALPVLVDDAVVATVMIYCTELGFFEADEVALLSEVARFLSLVIQAQSASERRLREEERFRALFEFSPMAMYVVDEDSGAILRINQALTQLLGYTHADLPSVDAAIRAFYPDPVYREQLRQVFAADLASLSAERTSVASPPLAVRSKDGRELFLQGFLARVGRELLVGWIDVTALRASQHLATEAQEIARIVAWEYDFASDTVHYADSAMQAALKASGRSQGLFDRIVPEDQERARAIFAAAVERRVPIDAVARYRFADGSIHHLRNRIRVEYHADGHPLRAIGTSQDVTEETLLAHELEAHRQNLEKLVDARTAELAHANAQLLVTDRRLKAILEMSQRAATLEEAELLQLAIDEAVRLTGSQVGYLHLLSEDEQRIEFNTWSTGVEAYCEAEHLAHYPVDKAGIWTEAVHTRAPSVQNDFAAALHREGYPLGHLRLRRHLVVPHVEDDRVRMLIGVGNKLPEYDPTDAQELELIARDIWGLVQRKRTESALKRAYEQVAASDERFAFAMAASAEGIWDWDLRTDVVSYSHEYLSVLGYTAAEFPTRGAEWGAFLHPDDRDAVLRARAEDLGHDEPSQHEFRIRRKDGTYIWAMTTGKVVERAEDGTARRAVGTFVDLSARRAAEQELRAAKEAADEANRAKSAFLAVMSHEIRTPLNGVIGMAEVLAQSPLPVREADAVRTIRNSAANLLTLIDDILDFSKIEAGRLDLEIVDTDLQELLDGIIASIGPVASAKHVDLSVFVAPDVPTRIRTDGTRLRQIIYNLLGNAIKFSAGRLERLGRVRVRVLADPGAPGRLRFEVRDNGIGISEDAQRRLFASFVQAETSTTRRYGGTGLGLAICRRLTELLRGEITVESTLGVGSTFTVALPVDVADPQPSVTLPDIAGLHCILVRGTDDFGQADDVARYLRWARAEVAIVATTEEGRARAMAAPPPAVLVEWTRPGEERGGIIESDDAVRHLRIAHGLRRHARLVSRDFVVLDQLAIRQDTIVRAVAIAAGRASPVVSPDDGDAPVVDPATKPLSVSEARSQGSLILVAEDDEINQKVILRQLELLGFAAEVASDGAEALAMWRRGTYAMLITDLHMPEMDGYALTAAIRNEEPVTQRMPIIALTANALRGEETRAKAAGMDEYLTKPIRLKDLKRALHHWLHADEPGSGPTDPGGSARDSGPHRRSSPMRGAPAEVATVTDSGGAAPIAVAESVLDVQVLKRYIGDDPTIMQEFLRQFRDAATQYRLTLLAAQQAGDLATIANTAHTFKSSARAVGALALGDLCAEVESAAKRHDVERLAMHFVNFHAEVARVHQRLDALLAPTA